MNNHKYLLIILALLSSAVAANGASNFSDSAEGLTELEVCENRPFLSIYTEGPGGIAANESLLEGVEDLTLGGDLGPEDLVVAWRATYLGSVTILNLRYALFYDYRTPDTALENGEMYLADGLPNFSFFHPEDQIDAESMTVMPIKLKKLICSCLQTTIGKFAYAYASELEEVVFVIPSILSYEYNLQYICDGAFIGCTKLPKVELSPGVLELGAFAFKDCTSLTDVSLPASLTKIGDKCFKNCSSIASIYCEAQEPPVCTEISEERGEGTFFGVPADAEIFVPVGSKELYENAPGWSHFTNIQEYAFASEGAVIEAATDAPCEVYNLSGVKVGTETDGLDAGLYLVRQGDKVTKVAVKK